MNTERLPDSGRFVALDSWRGLAAVGVLLAHLNEALPAIGWLGNGWIFVDFFFVLSGFVIAGGYWERLALGLPVSRFMLLRLGRLYPLHAFVLALFVVRELLQVVPYSQGLVLREPFTEGFDLTNFLLTATLTQSLPPATEVTWSGQSWSISVELWLYLVFGLLFSLPRRFALAAAAACMGLGVLALGPWADNPAPWLNPFLQRGFYAFGTGVCCWHWWSNGLRGHLAALSLLRATALEVVILGAVGIALAAGGGAYRLVVSVLFFAMLVLAFAAERGAISRLLRSRPFVLLGTLSYSIYMLHVLIIGTGITALRAAGLAEHSPASGNGAHSAVSGGVVAAFYLAILAATLAAAFLTWRFIEWPGMQWSRRVAGRFGISREERSSPTF